MYALFASVLVDHCMMLVVWLQCMMVVRLSSGKAKHARKQHGKMKVHSHADGNGCGQIIVREFIILHEHRPAVTGSISHNI
jgi:hypothetical protein